MQDPREVARQRRIAELSALRSSSSSATATLPVITQAAHGFVTGDAVYRAGGGWAKAIATSEATLAYGIADVSSADTFVVRQTGVVTMSGLTPATVYYLSATTAGALTATDPVSASTYSQPVGAALSATELLLLPYRPSGPWSAPRFNTVSKTANYTAVAHDLVLCNTSGGGFTVTLPSPGTAGETVGVKLVAGPGALTVSGTMFTNQSASTLTITDVGTSVTFVSDGSTWQVT